MTAFGKFVILKLVDPVKTTPGGIVLSDKFMEKPYKGTVVSCGSEVKNRTKLSDGTLVVFNAHNNQPIENDGEKYVVVHEDSVFATI